MKKSLISFIIVSGIIGIAVGTHRDITWIWLLSAIITGEAIHEMYNDLEK